jgi:hypothetical protein
MPPELGPAPAFLDPLRNQALVGAGQEAQLRDGLGPRPVLPTLAFSGAELGPGDLGQQVGAIAGDCPQFRCPGRLVGVGQDAAAGMAMGRPRQLGHEQPVRIRSATITSHVARIEYACDKCKLSAG